MTVAAEELSLRIKLLDDASAGTDRIAARVRALGAAGSVAAAGLTIAASAASALGTGIERGAARLVGVIDGVAGRILRTGKWIALAGAGFAAWEIKNVVKLHGELGDMEKVIRQVTGSAGKAREMVGMIFAEAGKPGAPGISELRDAVQALTTMGADPALWLNRMLDAAAGTGQALGEIVSQFRAIWMGGQQASLAYKRFGVSPESLGIMGKDRAADMERFAAAIEARYGGLADKVGGIFGGLLGSMRAKVQAFLYDATGPVVARIEADLKRVDAALGRTLGGSAGQRLGKTIAALYGAVSGRAEEFVLTGQSQGWKLAFGNLWRDIEPEIVRALKWAGGVAATAFWEAFKAVSKGAMRGEPWAIGLLGYEALKHGGPALAARGLEKGGSALWRRLGGGAATVGETAAGVAGGQLIRDAVTQRAILGSGGSAAGPATDYLLRAAGYGVAPIAVAKAGLLARLGGLLAKGGGALAAAWPAAAIAAAAALGGSALSYANNENPYVGTRWYQQPGRWAVSGIEWTGSLFGADRLLGSQGKARFLAGEAAEKQAMEIAGALRGAREALNAFKGALGDIVDGLEARIKSFAANQAQVESLVGGSRERVQEEYNDLIRKGMLPEDRRKAVLSDIAEISRRISEIDYSRVAAGAELLETARRHLGLLDEQWAKTKALAAEAEAIRAAEISESRAGILMGPAEFAQREAVRRAVQAMAPEEFADMWQAGRLKDVLGKYSLGEAVSEAQMAAWRARVGLGPFSEGGSGILTAEKAHQDAERARIEAETKKRTAEETQAVRVQIGAIEVALNLEDKDRIVDAVTLAIDKVEKEVKGAIEDALKEFQDQIGRRDK